MTAANASAYTQTPQKRPTEDPIMAPDTAESPETLQALHRTRTDDPFLTMEGKPSTQDHPGPENQRSCGPDEGQEGPDDPPGDRPNAPKPPHGRRPTCRLVLWGGRPGIDRQVGSQLDLTVARLATPRSAA